MNTNYFKRSYFVIAFFSLSLGFVACSDDDDDTVTPTATDPNAGLKSEIKANYADIVYASYEDSYNEALELQTAINAFTLSPTQAGFDNCKQKWLDAREPYGQTEAYRFANGPIDAENGPEGLLNAWPLDEGFVDYVVGNATTGLINNPSAYPNLNSNILDSLNETGGDKNISVGYHAIEFLLWGQDDPNTALKTPGNRPYTDYLTAGGTASNQARRAEYLKLSASLLVGHLKTMKDTWDASKSNNYYATFMNLTNDEALTNILTAIGTLSKSELATERMEAALKQQDQEEEHSCFSDNTHRDMILNAQGIRNIYIGEYNRVDGSIVSGKSIQDLIALVNSTLEGELNTLSSTSMTQVNAIPIPFDFSLTQEVLGGLGPIQTVIITLQSQGDKISELASALGITISTDL
ncbi:MAG: hypothetical protein JKY48_02275 [Flavobacteriales bacterium]|nr:hypothetical protein [Flavobacteriales bacterium]